MLVSMFDLVRIMGTALIIYQDLSNFTSFMREGARIKHQCRSAHVMIAKNLDKVP
jgi:hypothetical protein